MNFIMINVIILLISLAVSMGFIPSSFMKITHHRSSLSMKLSPVTGGSVVAIVTPMTSNNEIDYAKFIELLQWHVQEGTDGAVILGTTGEGSMISLSERSEIIKTAVRVVNKAFPIIVGAGTIEPSKVIELSQNALDNGADATLLITPYYVKPPQRALVQHYKYIADNVPIPMILYNCPGRTGVDMKPETIAQLASHPYIIGVKDATGDLDRVKKIRTLCGEKFLIFSGEDDQGCDHMKLGGDGVISVTANIAPSAMHKMLLLAKQGSVVEADEINSSLMLLHKRLFLESNPIPAKKALEIIGKIGSGIRSPLVSLDDIHLEALKEALVQAHVLKLVYYVADNVLLYELNSTLIALISHHHLTTLISLSSTVVRYLTKTYQQLRSNEIPIIDQFRTSE